MPPLMAQEHSYSIITGANILQLVSSLVRFSSLPDTSQHPVILTTFPLQTPSIIQNPAGFAIGPYVGLSSLRVLPLYADPSCTTD